MAVVGSKNPMSISPRPSAREALKQKIGVQRDILNDLVQLEKEIKWGELTASSERVLFAMIRAM